MSTPSVKYPAPTEEEKSIQAAQLAAMRKSEAREALWEPILMEEMGYRQITDPTTGETTLQQLTEEERYAALDAAEKQAYDIQKLASEREAMALRGELPVDPALERELSENEQKLAEQMTRQVGTGWETSTPGMYALAQQKQRAAELRDAMRRGEMTTSEALAQSRTGQLESAQRQFLEGSKEPTSRQMGIVSGYETPKSWLSQQRENAFQAKKAKAALEAEKMKQISGSFNSGMGAAGSAMGGCMCFNFLAIEGKITKNVKKFRDEHFPKDGYVSNGYVWMSTIVIPLLQKFPQLRGVMKAVGTQPLIDYADWYYGKKKLSIARWLVCKIIGQFWAKFWAISGFIARMLGYEAYQRTLNKSYIPKSWRN